MNNGTTQGIVPTVELAGANTNYPVYPMMGGYNNNGGFGGFGSDGLWFLILFALLFNNGGWGGNGGFGGNGFNNEYAWLSNGQKEIMANTNNGFDTLHLSNQVEGVRDGISGLSNQLCNCCADMNQTVSNGFYNAEIAAANRQMANMNQNFNNQIATLNGFNNLNTSLLNASADNRLGISNLNSTILAENCADRAALQEGVRDIITNATQNTQNVLDKLCQLELSGKQDRINELERQVLMKDLQASQVAQTADLRANNAVVANQLVSELRSCPIPAQPVYGNQPIFTCPNNLNYNGCGCTGTSQFI